MKKLIFTTVFLLGFVLSVAGQQLDKYQYVRVPEKFDFLKEENQYQLNALTAFLFDKFGFTALYKEKNPQGVNPCDILYANVHNDSGLFTTKLYVTLENCNKEVVLTSQTGLSREKDYKTAYHEALRKAFGSIEALQHTFTGEVVIDPVVSAEEREKYADTSEAASVPAEVIVDPVITSEEREELRVDKKSSEEKAFSGTYKNGSVSYTLKRTTDGFELFKTGDSEPFARLIKSGGGENYLYSSNAVNGNAYFDRDGNLIAEYVDANSGQVITVIYRKDQ